MSAVHRGIRQASRTLQRSSLCRTSALRPLSSSSWSAPRTAALRQTRNNFSTMASLQSAAAATPSPSESKGYDPEITDIANYVHNKPIDSDLAVSRRALCPAYLAPPKILDP